MNKHKKIRHFLIASVIFISIVFLAAHINADINNIAVTQLSTGSFEDTSTFREMDRVLLSEGNLTLSHTIDEGIVVGFERQISSLIFASNGKLYGGLWPDAQLMQYDPQQKGISDKGISGVGMMNLWALAQVPSDNHLYGGMGSGTVGYLISYDSSTDTFENLGSPINQQLDTPSAETDITALVGHDNGLIYGGTYPNAYLFTYDPVSNTFDNKGIASAEETMITELVINSTGNVIGSTSPGGKLFVYDPVADSIAQKGTILAGERIQSLVVADNGLVYGGTSPGGILFSFNPTNNEIINYGVPIPGETIIHDLALGTDGLIYGGTGPRGHLFSWDPISDTVVFMEMISHGETDVTSVTAGGGGVVYAGTSDNAHLIVYEPQSYQSNGFVTSTAQVLPDNKQWDRIFFQTTIQQGTTITIDILDSKGSLLLSNVQSGDSISSINPIKHQRLKLRANFTTDNGSQTAMLHSWSISKKPLHLIYLPSINNQ